MSPLPHGLPAATTTAARSRRTGRTGPQPPLVRSAPRARLYSPPVTALDLRSDTVTKPTAEMRRAMAEAEVGDDVFGEDPTVNALEERAAELLGKEAGLFVSTGHDGQPRRPDGARRRAATRSSPARRATSSSTRPPATPSSSERASARSGTGRTARSTRTRSRPPSATRPTSTSRRPPWSRSRTPTPHRQPAAVRSPTRSGRRRRPRARRPAPRGRGPVLQRRRRARASRRPTSRGPADSVTFCLSKGLSCPVGSVVVGSAAFIASARRARKLVGGGMRQAGILAAAGLVALRDGRRRDDRPTGRRPRQRPPARRAHGRDPRRPLARRHRPAGPGRRAARSVPRPRRTSSCSASPPTAPRSSPRPRPAASG